MAVGSALPFQLSKQLTGTNQEHFIDANHRVWFGTTNATFDLVHGAGFGITPQVLPTGGSLSVIGARAVGTLTGTAPAWNLSIQNFSGNDQLVSWSTTMSVAAGPSTSTLIGAWKIGFGSLDSIYPVFNWSVLGTALAKEFQYNSSVNGSLRFAGFVGARLFGEFNQMDTITSTFVTGSVTSQTTSGTLATICFIGTSPGILSPGYVVVYGSIGGTTGAIGNNPIATFRKYINDPLGTTEQGGGWLEVGAGTIWLATFFFNI